jgi:hypothetical protein
MYRLWRDSTRYNGSSQGNNRGLQSINGRKVFSSNNKMFENPMGANTLFAGLSATVLAAALAF